MLVSKANAILQFRLKAAFFPLYFSEVFPIAHGQTITGDPSYSFMQIIRLSIYYGPVTLFTLIGIIINAYHMLRYKHGFSKITYEFCQIIFILLPLFIIAENQGTNYTYYLQLWYPYIILYGIASASDALKHLRQKYESPVCIDEPKTFLPMVCSILICLLVVLSLVKVLPSYHSESMTQEQQAAWNNAYNILDHYSSDGEYHLTEDDFTNAGYHIVATEELMSGTHCWHTVFYALTD